VSDLVSYRIPGEEISIRSGQFVEQTKSELKDGFVVCPFLGDKAYWFDEDRGSEEMSEYHFSQPTCYSKDEYLTKADEFIREIQNQNLSKAILSRIKVTSTRANPDALFEKLCRAYPKAFVYLVSSSHFGTWIGATPEILLTCENGVGKSIALAGTMKSDGQAPWGEKEINEQKFVADFISEQLSNDFPELEIDGPNEMIAGPVKHLATTFEFSLNSKRPIDVALSLHPTPAVSGLPRKESIELINYVEEHNRSLYTGFIGLLGDTTELYVNLRCAQIYANEAFLYLGGGFTKDSVSEKEWEETENKSRTLLDILENN
jgi:isochorismate synthase